jgi:uncharacterized protein
LKVSLLFLLLALLAEIIGTVGGFGSSVFFVPIANFYFDFYSVLGLTALFHLSSNLSKIFLFKKGIDKTLLLYIGAPSVVMVVVGGLLSKVADGWLLQVCLGGFLILLSLIFLVRKNLVVTPNKKNSIIGGSLSGFSAGLLGTGGAIRGLTMAAFNLEKSVFIATSAAIDLMIDASRTVVYFNNGYMSKDLLIYLPFLLAIGFVGSYFGKRILNYIPQTRFRVLSLVLVLIVGIITLINVF